MIYLKISTKLQKYLLRKYINKFASLDTPVQYNANTLKNHKDSILIFGMLIVVYVRNKIIEKIFLSRMGVLWSCEVKVPRSEQKITFLFICIYSRYEYHLKAAKKSFPMMLTSLKWNKK